MSLLPALGTESSEKWSEEFEASWIDNGWDAAFRNGRNPGELQTWLRDYDPNGTAGVWEPREKPETTAERLKSL